MATLTSKTVVTKKLLFDIEKQYLEQYSYKNETDEKEANEILSRLYPNIANIYIKLKKLRPAMT